MLDPALQVQMRAPEWSRYLAKPAQRHDAVEQFLGVAAERFLVCGFADAEVECRVPTFAAHAHDVGKQELSRTLVGQLTADHRVEHAAEPAVGGGGGQFL